MRLPRLKSIPISEITVSDDETAIAHASDDLAASMAEVGLLQPILVTPGDQGFQLVAGRRRLNAARTLGWTTITANVLSLDDLRIEIAAVDENVVRRELTVLERGEQLRRRKQLYEALHPDTRNGRAGGLASASSRRSETATIPTLGFVQDATKKLGRSKSAIHREIKIATAIPGDVRDRLRHLAVADDLTDLGRLAGLSVPDMRAVTKKIERGDARGVVHALRLVESSRVRRRRQSLPGGKFDVLVVDPPWRFENDRTPYSSMPLEEIQALPVGELASENSILFLWTTNAHMRYAYSCLDAWGFTDRTILTWDKQRNSGMGHYLIGCSEHAILATKGRPTICRTTQTTLLRAPAGKHSTKPDEFFLMVEQLCPSPRRIELFARRRRDAWVSWGDISPNTKRAG